MSSFLLQRKNATRQTKAMSFLLYIGVALPRLEPTSSAMIPFVCWLPTTGREGGGRGNCSQCCFISNFPTPSLAYNDPLRGEEAGFNTVVVVDVALIVVVVVVAADDAMKKKGELEYHKKLLDRKWR